MPVGINGYNDAFKAFTDFGKGKPLTAEDVDTIGKACLFNSVNI